MPHKTYDHAAIAAAAKAAPGEWTHIGVYDSDESAAGMARHIRAGRKAAAYAPAGTFEVYPARVPDGTALWTRYVAFVPDLKPRPESMTYQVCDRGSGREYVGVRIVSVTVAAECPECGGPRGEATPFRFCEDGKWHTVSRWSNPCGHVDMYASILREHHQRVARQEEQEQKDAAWAIRSGPVLAGPFTGAVLLLNATAAETRGLTARQAARFLAGQGHYEPAVLIEEEIEKRGGCWSARKAAVWLAELGAARAGESGDVSVAPAAGAEPLEASAQRASDRCLAYDARPIGVVAAERVEQSTQPARFRACMSEALKAYKAGEDLATARRCLDDPLKVAAEIEALAGLRRLAQQGGAR
ncbi:hypothetical protein ACFWAP_03990 [Streptomyces goshikiensis]|uniref:hypothetical protein n=1 Tax=Streptomyces goshikiensis TaxID=1942 RepID=UPI003646AB19